MKKRLFLIMRTVGDEHDQVMKVLEPAVAVTTTHGHPSIIRLFLGKIINFSIQKNGEIRERLRSNVSATK